MKPHKHAEAIKAWADGATIEIFTDNEKWEHAPHPSWMENMEYRIKREPKPDIAVETFLFENMAVPSTANIKDQSWHHWLKNADAYTAVGKFKLTYDGETGTLKHIELVK